MSDAIATERLAAGDAAGAAAGYRALVEANPQSAPILERYAAFQFQAGDKTGARQSLARAQTLAPGDIAYVRDLARMDLDEKGPDAAIATARSFAAHDQVAADVLVSELLVEANRKPDAIAALKAAQQAHPASALAIQLAALEAATGAKPDAEALLQRWLEAHPNDLRARLLLGGLYLADRDYDRAQAQYEEVRHQDPKNAAAVNDLAWLYAQKGDAKAHDLAAEAYALQPSPATADTLGWTLVGSGDARHGLDYLRQASAADPQNPTVQYHLAVALNATGDRAGARKLLEQVLQSGGEFDDKHGAQKLLTQLDRG